MEPSGILPDPPLIVEMEGGGVSLDDLPDLFCCDKWFLFHNGFLSKTFYPPHTLLLPRAPPYGVHGPAALGDRILRRLCRLPYSVYGPAAPQRMDQTTGTTCMMLVSVAGSFRLA